MSSLEREQSHRHTGTWFARNVDIVDHYHPAEGDVETDEDILRQHKRAALKDLQDAVSIYRGF